METPRCDCHGEPMLWNQKPSQPCGGTWRCRIRTREQNRRSYRANRESRLAHQRAHYEQNALPRLMRQQLNYRRKRLAALEEQLNV